MPERLQYHFEPKKGWMNDPNGLVFFQGKYHAFFQHYPHAPRWGQMHWGHAVSEDLIHWEELPIALYPDMPYEDEGGCFSGSAVVRGGELFLFYTSVSKALGQTQSVAVSRDGLHFEKFAENPVIRRFPPDGSRDFRDPKVGRFGDEWIMVCGSGRDGCGKVLAFASRDLLHWEYRGVLFADASCGPVLECPDLFELDGKAVLMFSKMGLETDTTQFVIGSFDGERFAEESRCSAEVGPQFYAPQTFAAPDGRRIMIGWLYDWKKPLDEGADYAGALTLPRELTLRDGRVLAAPVGEARSLLTGEDPMVSAEGETITVCGRAFPLGERIGSYSVLRDTKTLEVFVNGGRRNVSFWFGR